MTSSYEEIFEVFKPLIDMGIADIVTNTVNEKHSKVIYDKLGTMGEVFTFSEMANLPNSMNMQDAIKKGCRSNEQILEYCEKIIIEKKEEAIKTDKDFIVDTIGMFLCQDPNEECNWDMIYEMVTPKGGLLYMRNHCY